MRVLMLGWEFPPYLTGGLGSACYGLTRALAHEHVEITFVLPRALPADHPTHVRLLGPEHDESLSPAPVCDPLGRPIPAQAMSRVDFIAVPAGFTSPYPQSGDAAVDAALRQAARSPGSVLYQAPGTGPTDDAGPGPGGASLHWANYTGDLVAQSHRYARFCVRRLSRESFDVIHAHDWLTFPAALALAGATGKPLVVHLHSTEFDRSGSHVQHPVYDIERRGMLGAMRVIAVSHMTRNVLVHRYGVRPDKISVIYNGMDPWPAATTQGPAVIHRGDKVVLFLGRITLQKGPEYFIAAAKKVLQHFDRVKFIVAGSGDRIREIIDLAAAENIGHKVLFTGFLEPADVERVFHMADLYVMPSVSEPFGLTPLEAIRHDVPVIVSKQSGVSEVLRHALKVDFWDTDDLADKMLAVLRHPPLGTTLREHAELEVRKLTWDDAGRRCVQVYHQAIAQMPVA